MRKSTHDARLAWIGSAMDARPLPEAGFRRQVLKGAIGSAADEGGGVSDE